MHNRLSTLSLTVSIVCRMVKAKVYIFKKQYEGFPTEENFELVEEELPPINDGEFLAEAIYISVDPFMRAYAPKLIVGTTFIGTQIASIVESKNPDYPVGKNVVGDFGWRTHTISDGKEIFKNRPMVLPDLEDIPLSYALGVLGMPGNTAYFGFLEICKPQAGETVVVSGAGGAVGSLVGQIAKIKGCKVIGIAGSDEKGEWLVNELKFDHFINYKTEDVQKTLIKVAPQGIDCYFDNVGGVISHSVMTQMKEFGRVSVSGAISGYNDVKATAPLAQFPIVFNQLKVEGFIVFKWREKWMEGIEQNKKWILEGKLKTKETITDGFENMLKAFNGMLKGENIGKALLKI